MDWKPLRIYFWLAFGVTWGVGGVGLLIGMYRPEWTLSRWNPLLYIAVFGPSVAGMIMAARAEGQAGIKRLLARAIPVPRRIPWYLAVIVGFPAAVLLASLFMSPDDLHRLWKWDQLLLLLPLILITDPGPLGEEFGWRGFALPRLLRLQSPLVAALILGVVWGIWHLPAFFISTLSQSQLSFPVFLLNSIALSIIMTWLYRRTSGDLFLMILVHLMANYCGHLGMSFHSEVIAEVAVAAWIIAAGGLRNRSPQIKG